MTAEISYSFAVVPRGGGGNFNSGRLRPEVQPLTLFCCEKYLYTFY